MTYAKLSTKYQIVIPKEVRRRLALKPRQRFIIQDKGGVIYLVPDVPLKHLAGALPVAGLDLSDVRDKEDHW